MNINMSVTYGRMVSIVSKQGKQIKSSIIRDVTHPRLLPTGQCATCVSISQDNTSIHLRDYSEVKVDVEHDDENRITHIKQNITEMCVSHQRQKTCHHTKKTIDLSKHYETYIQHIITLKLSSSKLPLSVAM